MNTDTMLEALRHMLFVSMMLSMPILGVALVIGLAVGLLQAITSIQEQTLAFIPKLIGMVLVLVLLGGWMTRVLVDYSADLFGGIWRFGAL